jgi:hypothetical protein
VRRPFPWPRGLVGGIGAVIMRAKTEPDRGSPSESSGNMPTVDEATAVADSRAARAPRPSRLLRWVSLLGMMSLAFVLGAAVMFFNLPSSSFLRRAFVGGVAWYEGRQDPDRVEERPSLRNVSQVDKPDKTCDGFTLCMWGKGSQAVLIDMRGEVVHSWHVPFSKIWSDPPHLRGPIDDASVYFNDGYVYPNGDIVVVIEGPTDVRNASNGFGLAKLDKDGHVLWKYAETCHHDVDVGDDGLIYAIVNETVWTVPKGLERIQIPCLVDVIHVISPDGKTLKKVPVLEAIHDSPYAALLGVYERPRTMMGEAPPTQGQPPEMSALQDDLRNRDVLHTNAVHVLNRSLAVTFPMFKAGQLLISPRSLDAIAVLDLDSGKVVWAARGPWRAQHDPSFLDNGHLLVFDNLGSHRGSRVLEYDVQTQAFPWVYPGETGKPFLSKIRGMAQRLRNGNTLVVNSVGGEILEVTPGQEVVWSCSSGGAEIKRARRYMPTQLSFLKGDLRARP